MTDPIADMLTRIRNAVHARHPRVDVPASHFKAEIARILEQEGYISGFKRVETDGAPAVIRISLKYGPRGENVISGLERVSRPGRRIYTRKTDIPWVLSGIGVAILSTPKGVMTGARARQLGVGGEILCKVW